jgi:DNA-dependent RNA polymerase auxiliary subunit epsilon
MSEDVPNYNDVLMAPGDIVQVLTEDDAGNTGMQYAIVNEVMSSNKLFVNYIEPIKDDDGAYELDDHAFEITRESVNAHYTVDDSTPEALQKSFMPIGLEITQNDDARMAFEICESDDEEDDDGSDLEDFVVPDEESSPFSKAPETSAFARETHAAVREFESWEPQNDGERNVKEYVAGMAGSAAHANEDARMARGEPPIADYTCRT